MSLKQGAQFKKKEKALTVHMHLEYMHTEGNLVLQGCRSSSYPEQVMEPAMRTQ